MAEGAESSGEASTFATDPGKPAPGSGQSRSFPALELAQGGLERVLGPGARRRDLVDLGDTRVGGAAALAGRHAVGLLVERRATARAQPAARGSTRAQLTHRVRELDRLV